MLTFLLMSDSTGHKSSIIRTTQQFNKLLSNSPVLSVMVHNQLVNGSFTEATCNWLIGQGAKKNHTFEIWVLQYSQREMAQLNLVATNLQILLQPIDLMHWRHKGSHLHNNDASLVSRSAHVLCWQCALALSLSVRGPGRASPAVWLAGFAPLAACLAMTHVAVFRLTPNAAGRPSVTS